MNTPWISVSSKAAHGPQNDSFAPIKKIHFQAMLLSMVLSLLYVTYDTQFAAHPSQESTLSKEKVDLVFKDGEHGEIIIGTVKRENDKAYVIHEMTMQGEQGFLRGTLRALARERKTRHMSPDEPFELKLDTDGRLSITDSLTSNTINLDAFGPDNLAVFLNIMNESKKSIMTHESSKQLKDHSKEMK